MVGFTWIGLGNYVASLTAFAAARACAEAARDPNQLRVGYSLDFWRVEMVEPGKLIRLRAEMSTRTRMTGV